METLVTTILTRLAGEGTGWTLTVLLAIGLIIVSRLYIKELKDRANEARSDTKLMAATAHEGTVAARANTLALEASTLNNAERMRVLTEIVIQQKEMQAKFDYQISEIRSRLETMRGH